jgi:hypothetical protein
MRTPLPATDTAQSTWLVRSLVLLAAGLAANSILGPLALDIIEYRYSDSLINQGIGLDVVALLAASPIAVVAATLVARRHRAGPVLAFIPAMFAAYMAPQYVIGPDYLGLPGNNERFVVFHLALFIVGAATAILAWRAVDRKQLRPDTADSDRRRSLVLFGVVAFIFAGRWLAGLADLVAGDPTSVDYRENPTAYLLIGFLDLGIIVPAATATAIGLRRHAVWARTAGYAVIGWFALVPAAVAAMAVVMQINDDPNATTGSTIVFVAAGTVFTLGATWLYRPMLRTAPADERSTPESETVGVATRLLDQPDHQGATP